jgi:hypothetical protein
LKKGSEPTLADWKELQYYSTKERYDIKEFSVDEFIKTYEQRRELKEILRLEEEERKAYAILKAEQPGFSYSLPSRAASRRQSKAPFEPVAPANGTIIEALPGSLLLPRRMSHDKEETPYINNGTPTFEKPIKKEPTGGFYFGLKGPAPNLQNLPSFLSTPDTPNTPTKRRSGTKPPSFLQTLSLSSLVSSMPNTPSGPSRRGSKGSETSANSSRRGSAQRGELEAQKVERGRVERKIALSILNKLRIFRTETEISFLAQYFKDFKAFHNVSDFLMLQMCSVMTVQEYPSGCTGLRKITYF